MSPGDWRGVFTAVMLLLFVENYPSSWQAFRDRANAMRARILAEVGAGDWQQAGDRDIAETIEAVIGLVPVLLAGRSGSAD